MAVYGISQYGADFYGYDFPPAYRVDPFVATSINYTSVQVTWTAPQGTIEAYRLVKNRFGFPVDQDDGEILIDTVNYPGNQFVDTNVEPGTYQYYGFFVLLDFLSNTWVRSGWTACLAINNYNTGLQINELIPDFYKQTPELSPVQSPEFPTTTLDFFCEVLGWGADYLKTQYDTYANINNPWAIPVKDLYNLGLQLGLNINPDIHPYTLRKAIYFNAEVNKNRGTTVGINQELESLTGWATDLQIANNFMLENTQSNFSYPNYPAWNPNINYLLNEHVTFNGFVYISLVNTGNINTPPTGTNSSNTQWSPVVGSDSSTALHNSVTGNINTWECLGLNSTTGQGTAITERIGIVDPQNSASTTANGLDCTNTSGSTGTILIRSISRVPGDITTNGPSFPPNKDQVVGDGIPVPFVNNPATWNGTTWNSTTRFGTDDIVTYLNVPFMALRASTNVVPPVTTRGGVSNEWFPISMEPRIRLMVSGYFQGSTTGMTVTPFVDWFDSNGNFLTRVTARNTTAGSNTLPTGLVFDSFTYPTAPAFAGRRTDDAGFIWSVPVGQFDKSQFADGCVYPGVSTTRTYATVNSGVSDCQVGITFVTNPSASTVTGILMRFLDDNDYLMATMTGIFSKVGGTYNNLGSYSEPAVPGDRLVVTLSGSTITAFVSGTQVLQVTSTFNQTGTVHGIINDIISNTGPGGSVMVTNPGTQNSVVGTGI